MKKYFWLFLSVFFPSLTLATSLHVPVPKIAEDYLSLIQNKDHQVLINQASILNEQGERLIQLCLSGQTLGVISTATDACILPDGSLLQKEHFIPLLSDEKSVQTLYNALIQQPRKNVKWRLETRSGKLCFISPNSPMTNTCLIPGSRYQEFGRRINTRQINEMNIGNSTGGINGTALCCDSSTNPSHDTATKIVVGVGCLIAGGGFIAFLVALAYYCCRNEENKPQSNYMLP